MEQLAKLPRFHRPKLSAEPPGVSDRSILRNLIEYYVCPRFLILRGDTIATRFKIDRILSLTL